MDFDLTPDQESLRGLARDIFTGHCTLPRIEAVEASGEKFDRDLWQVLADAGLLGVAIPEDQGGLGLGLVDLMLVLSELGRAVASVPLAWTAVASLVLLELASDDQRDAWLPGVASGDLIVTTVLEQCALSVSAVGDALTGTVTAAPYSHIADLILIPVGSEVYAIDPRDAGVESVPVFATNHEWQGQLTLSAVPAQRIGEGAAATMSARAMVALAAVQSGVTEAALRLAADYTSQRLQFEKPLSSFQGVALKAADGYVDAAAIRSTMLQAAWLLERGEPAVAEVLSAAWWAAEGGQHCVHITQHLHGGMGADVTYPVHRYFLWGKQIELMLGGASAIQERLGNALLGLPNAGDELVLT